MVINLQDIELSDGTQNLENSTRRRKIMDFKISFKKKKSRYDSDSTDGNSVDKHRRNVHKNKIEIQEEKPRGIIARLFPFRRNKRKDKNNCKTGDQMQIVETKYSDSVADRAVRLQTEQKCMLQNQLGLDGKAKECTSKMSTISKSNGGHPNVSLSSPNLTFVEWSSFESVSDHEEDSERRKHGSLRRSRASLVFPVSEIGHGVFKKLKHTMSERDIPCRPNSNIINHTQSCLPLDDGTQREDNFDNFDKKFSVSNILPDSLLSRTPDGRSPHPGKRNVCSNTFSLSGIIEDDSSNKMVLNLKKSTNSVINDQWIVNTDSSDHVKRKDAISQSQDSIVFYSKRNMIKGEFPIDNSQMEHKTSLHMQKNERHVRKPLGRFTSCPGICENNELELKSENYFPSRTVKLRENDLQPYSSHRRPYSMHEGMRPAHSTALYQQTLSLRNDDFLMDDCEPPENQLTLPSKDLPLAFAEALWDHQDPHKTELTFNAGDMIAVYFMNNQNWWWGTRGNQQGWFPSSHVRLRVDQELDNSEKETGAIKERSKTHNMPLARRNTFSLLGLQDNLQTDDDVRSRCVQELLTSEKDYLKTLRDVSEGYLKQIRKKPEMFKREDIGVIFSNIEEIFDFHKKFYRELHKRIDHKDMYKSQIGQLFVKHKSEFHIYSEYCNNHPSACTRLLELQKEEKYRLFFEHCRLLQQMICLSIDAFLLTPVQKICKYPLQLNELLKYTPTEHADHEPLQAAVNVMRDVASTINERKRKFENLISLAEWQLNVDGWQGADILEHSSECIKRGSLQRTVGGKTEEIHLSLLDHQMILCKKDSYKKNSRLLYLERLNLDHATFESTDEYTGQVTEYSLKVTQDSESFTHSFSFRSNEERDDWMKALSKERQIVENEKVSGYSIPRSVRLGAMESARSKNKSGCKKEHRRRKSLTDPFQGFEFGANVIRRSLRLRRTQSLREKKSSKGH